MYRLSLDFVAQVSQHRLYTVMVPFIHSSVRMLVMGFLHIDEVFNVNCASSSFELTALQRKIVISSSTICTSWIFVTSARGGIACEITSDIKTIFRDCKATSEWTYQKWADECRLYGIICKPLMVPHYYHRCMDNIEDERFYCWFQSSAGLPLSISVIIAEPQLVENWYIHGSSLIDQRYDDTKGTEYLTKGMEYLTKAARQGCFDAQCRLSSSLANVDDGRSRFWLQQSLDQNPADSANSWKESSAGLPLSEDYTDFLTLTEQQDNWCELGLQAISSLNKFEQRKGIEYLTGAARKGHTSAQYELGKALQNMDLIDRALFWYNKAAYKCQCDLWHVAAKKATEAIEAINRRPAKRLRN